MDSPRFDPIDYDQLKLLAQLTPGQRLQAMLDARALVIGLVRGHLRRRYPHLSDAELNRKVMEQLQHVDQHVPRFRPPY